MHARHLSNETRDKRGMNEIGHGGILMKRQREDKTIIDTTGRLDEYNFNEGDSSERRIITLLSRQLTQRVRYTRGIEINRADTRERCKMLTFHGENTFCATNACLFRDVYYHGATKDAFISDYCCPPRNK